MSQLTPIPTDKLAQFTLTEETLNNFRKNRSIPFDLYGKNGELLFLKKKNPTKEDFEKLLRFELQGVYFHVADVDKDKMSESRQTEALAKILDPTKVKKFADDAAIFLDKLKQETFSSSQAIAIQNSVTEVLNDFTNNPFAETGILNILEILDNAGVPLQSELMTKRTIVAMGMKVRARKIVPDGDKKPYLKEHLAIMMASYLADVGYVKLHYKDDSKLSKEDYLNVQQHPIISYLMTLPASEISPEIRSLILNHHRPYRGAGINNNFPNSRIIFSKLMAVRDQYTHHVGKERIVKEIETQLHMQEHQMTIANRDEDIAILSLASEFASLTSRQPWRPAYSSKIAMKMILNNSFFSYSIKNIKLLLDSVGTSLNDNQHIIQAGDFVITAAADSENQIIYDLNIVIEEGQHQTHPKIQRICNIKPIFKKGNKYLIYDFDLTQIKLDRRRPVIDLASQTASTQRLMYIIDKTMNEPLFDIVTKINKAN